MKRILSLTLSITAVLALMAPVAAHAQMPTPTPKGKGGGGPPPSKSFLHATPPQKPVVHQQYVKPTVKATPMPKGPVKPYVKPQYVKPTPGPSITKGPGYKKPVGGSNPPPTGKGPVIKNTKLVNVNVHIKQNKNWAGPKAGGGAGGSHGPQFTQGNNYGGHWVAGSSHADWSRGQEHDWNGHHWRWFNGGWLNIDGGFWPAGYYNFYSGPSKIYDAQAELANMGYYNGVVDGIPGPMTRQAIANYQNDYQLPVTGHLNIPTQESLGLIPPPPAPQD